MDLNTILIILGILALVALVAHGLWSNRREKSRYFENANAFSRDNRSPVQTGSLHTQVNAPDFVQANQPQQNTMQMPSNGENTFAQQSIASSSPTYQEPRTVEEIKITLADHYPSQPPTYDMKPQYQASPMQKELAIDDVATADDYYDNNTSVENLRVQLQEPANTVNSLAETPIQQPIQQQMVSSAPLQQPVAETKTPTTTTSQQSHANGYVVLYIVAPENRQFQGLKLAQALEDAGFMFGRNDRYHYHLHLNMASPILFTVANINQPGTFNPYGMTEFTTLGIALYMQLPSIGNDKANLKTMIRTAKNLANQLGGFVLTDQQELFSDLSEQEYFAKLN